MQPVINTNLVRAHSAALFIPSMSTALSALFTEVQEPVMQTHVLQPHHVLPVVLTRLIIIFTPATPAAALPALITQLPVQDIQQNAIQAAYAPVSIRPIHNTARIPPAPALSILHREPATPRNVPKLRLPNAPSSILWIIIMTVPSTQRM